MARKFIYSILVLAVLAVAAITVYLCVADSKSGNSDNNGFAGNYDAEVQSILVSYESDDITDKCQRYLAERASQAISRRRRRLVDTEAIAALDSFAHILEATLKQLGGSSAQRENTVKFNSDIEERADAAALQLMMGEQTPSDGDSSNAKLVRSAVAPLLWSAIPPRQYSVAGGLPSVPMLTAVSQSTSSFDEDSLHLKTIGVQDVNSSSSSYNNPTDDHDINSTDSINPPNPKGDLVAVSRWLKHVDLDVVRLIESKVAVDEIIALANDTPCVSYVESDMLIPIEDPPSTMVRSEARRRLFGFNDLLNEAKSAASAVGDWIASTVPDDVKDTAKDAADTVGNWFKENLSQEAIKEQASKVSGWAQDNIVPLYEDTKNVVKSFGEKISPHLQTAWESLTNTGEKAKAEISKAIEDAKKQFENDPELKAALNEIEQTAKSSIMEWEKDMSEALEKISLPDDNDTQHTSDVDTVLGSGVYELGTLIIETEQSINAIVQDARNTRTVHNTRGAALPPQSFSLEESDDNEQTLTESNMTLDSEDLSTANLLQASGHIAAAQRRRRLQQDNSTLLKTVFGVGNLDEVAGTSPDILLGLASRQPVAEDAKGTIPNDALFREQWSLQTIDAPTGYYLIAKAHNRVNNNDDLILAVLDTGCDVEHEDLKNRLWTNPGEICDDGIDNDDNGYIDDCHGFNFYDHNNDLIESKVHGTSVSGAALAETGNGLGVASACTHCKLMCLRVGKTGFNTAAFAEAVNYLLNYDVPVINYSGNGGRSENQVKALEKAAERDVTIVVSAGNSNCDLDGSASCVNSGYPAILPNDNIIVVGASTDTNSSAYYSSHGKSKVHVHAPAGDLLPRPNNNYATVLGTSFSAPTVAGLAGMIRYSYPTLTTQQVKQAIIESCYPHASLQNMNACGGIVDFAAAITAASKLANDDSL